MDHVCIKQRSFKQHYAVAWNLDAEVLSQSSSGGMFQAFAKVVIEQGGWVFGTEFTREKLASVAGYNDGRYKRFSGSKYVKSNINQAFKDIKDRLDEGKTVLFGGTPCQCAALRSYLKQEYVKLYMVDIICHGSPRADVFEKYLCYLEKKQRADVVDVEFRNKEKGWKSGQIVVHFSDGSELKELFHPRKNKYANIFYSNIALMAGCRECRYNTLDRYGDVTLGDFWGYKSYPDMKINEDGTSVVLINSSKGERLLELCRGDLFVETVEQKVAIANNPPLYEHTKINPLTKVFCDLVKKDEFIFAYYYCLVFLRYVSAPVKLVKRIVKR